MCNQHRVCVKDTIDHNQRPCYNQDKKELYFGGLESIGFGRCQVNIKKIVGDV